MRPSHPLHALVLLSLLLVGCDTLTAGVFSRDNYGKTPILFVHGRGLSAGSFKTMIRGLEASGYPPSYLRAIDLYPKDAPNIPSAEKQIAPFVERFLADINEEIRRKNIPVAPKTKINIVAHSMGSVSSRWYAAKLRPDRVDTWISLAGSNHGTEVGCPGLPRSGKAELCPAYGKTPIQVALNGAPGSDTDETPYGVGADGPGKRRIPPDDTRRILYLTLRTANDEFIVPNSSTVVDGAGGIDMDLSRSLPVRETSPGNYITLSDVKHDWLPFTGFVIDFVDHALNRDP